MLIPAELRLIDSFEPLGIDLPNPRFGWKSQSEERSKRQSAYRILVSDDPVLLELYLGNIWDSGKVSSSEQYGIVYEGIPLLSHKRYWWTVMLWDERGNESPFAEQASFTTGFLKHRFNAALADNGGIATASSEFSHFFPASSANNGDRKGHFWGNCGGWRSSALSGQGEWLQIRFMQDQLIDRIDVFTLQDDFEGKSAIPNEHMEATQFGIRDYEVQYYVGAEWKTVPGGEVKDNRFVWRTFRFPPTLTDRIRVVATRGADDSARIVELEAWTPSEWSTKWIRHPDSSAHPLFRTSFKPREPIVEALAYVCGLGQFVWYLNGVKVGDHELDPGWTDYDESCQYVVFDLKGLIREKTENVVGVALGNGWYKTVGESGGRHCDRDQVHFGTVKLLMEIHIHYADGTKDIVRSDETWKTSIGPYTLTNVYGSEDYDARLEQEGWNCEGFDDRHWVNALTTEAPHRRLTSQKQPPLTVQQVYEAQAIHEPVPGVYVYDLGQNLHGLFEIEVSGPCGAAVTIKPCEKLFDDGTVDQPWGDTYCIYTLKGEGREVWRPQFSTYGGRYVQIEGASRSLKNASGKPVIHKVRGLFITSAARTVGRFTTSDCRYNSIYHLVLKAIENNLVSVFTDCPQIEKLGWLEQSHLMGRSIMYVKDVQTLWTKIAQDCREGQYPDGLVPNVCPEYEVFPGDFRDSPEWGGAAVISPWLVYQFYGDTDILRQNYLSMVRYVGYLKTKESEDQLLEFGLGDWVSADGNCPPNVASAIYYYMLTLLRNISSLIGHQEEAEYYDSEAERIKHAYNRKFFDEDRYHYANQTNQALPMCVGLVPQGKETEVMKALLSNIHARGNHLSAGDVGLRYLFQALGNFGYENLVQSMIMQEEHPSYWRFVQDGETSLPEEWHDRARSRNHAMLGSIMEWFYEVLGGISMSLPGFKAITIKPHFPDGLEEVQCSFHSVHGLISVEWARQRAGIQLEVTVPPNTLAEVYVPVFGDSEAVIKEGTKVIWQHRLFIPSVKGVSWLDQNHRYVSFEVGSGTYLFTVETEESS